MNDVAIELKGLRKAFGATEIIRGANLRVERGERLALIGPNGAGKSTLFNLMSGFLQPTSGEILLNGEAVGGLAPDRIHHRGVARSFQISSVFHNLSVFENLRVALLWSCGHRYAFWRRLSTLHNVNERAEEMLERIGLARQRHVQAGLLTYADQRALEIGLTVIGGKDVILLDEPTAGMSRAESDAAVDMILRVTEGKTLIMVEHDMSVVFGLADRIAVLVYGEVIACDVPQSIRKNERVRDAYLGDHAEKAIA
ncbi:ABC transporter ATP-binding protein [Hydrogenophaga laconesensis]|uniref:Branched-chain amino acid transport system ATP-binding protein n=1 Tax=Hydrogenophaga laconesensis TaxID=1805971 RepID=A0ABU1VIZ6_9BURK|nr:ABC transporter ATP-binding protein [Hydrogenophaga laconesensis]MDR7097450.1 branched-chain amino acid transport system ATP-binding protein [Hydrogenophaga laconesensis]